MKTVLFLALSVSVYATPAGIFQWTGDPSLAPGCFCTPLDIFSDPTGISGMVSLWVPGKVAVEDFSVIRPFRVTHPGGFLLTSEAQLQGQGELISPIGGFADLTVEFQAWDSAGGPGLTLSGSQTEPWTPITVSAHSSELFVLPRGNYILQENMDASVTSASDSFMNLSFEEDLVGMDPPDPTPEPSMVLLIIAGMAGIAFWRRK